jgi:hypothetical protein
MAGDKHNVVHGTRSLWRLLGDLGPHRQPRVLCGDKAWGVQAVMAGAVRFAGAFAPRTRISL